MLSKLIAIVGIIAATAAPVLAQAPTIVAPGTEAQMPASDPAGSAVTPPPGVSDPLATNSTTGTVDHEDHCQPPGTTANSNPSADNLSLPRPDAACN